MKILHKLLISSLSFLLLQGKLNASSCKRPVYASGCLSNFDCGDYNNHALECKFNTKNIQDNSTGQCLCPEGNQACKRGLPAQVDTAAQFSNCSIAIGCAGHGQSQGGKNITDGNTCQEVLVCVPTILNGSHEIPMAFCHTCSSCKANLERRFNCSQACDGANNSHEFQQPQSLKEKMEESNPEIAKPTILNTVKKTVQSLSMLVNPFHSKYSSTMNAENGENQTMSSTNSSETKTSNLDSNSSRTRRSGDKEKVNGAHQLALNLPLVALLVVLISRNN